MISIWLCDDENLFLTSTESIISSIFKEKRIECEVRLFSCSESLFAALPSSQLDLLFLDLILGNENGFDIADKICRHKLDTELVFITNYPEKMSEAFSYRPIGFLAKPVDLKKLEAVIDRFLFFYQQKKITYTISTRSMSLCVYIRDILYFESKSHQIFLFVSGHPAPIQYTGKLDDIESELSAFHFVRCHKSFLINTHAIAALNHREMTVLLNNGMTLPISRRCYASVCQRFAEDKIR